MSRAIFRRPLAAALALTLGLGALPAYADLGSVRGVLAERMRAKKIPFSPSSVRETLIQGLYRWEQGPGVGQLYVNDAVTLILVTDGSKIVEWTQPVRDPQPISEAEKNSLLSEMLRGIRFDRLIKFEQGKGQVGNQVLLISAFDCPYCIKFERMLAGAGDKVDATVYVLPSTLQPKDNARASTVRNIWCAKQNAEVWRNALLKSPGGYYSNLPSGSCDLGVEAARDVQLIVASMGLGGGYPQMLFGNGTTSTAAQELPVFQDQLRKNPGRVFWDEPKPQRYAQFRAAGGNTAASGSAAAAAAGISTSGGTTTIRFNPLSGLLKKLGTPAAAEGAGPAPEDAAK